MMRLAALLRHAGIQLLAVLLAWVFWAPLLTPLPWLAAQCLLAVLLASVLRCSLPQRLLHLLFMPLVVLALWQQWAPWLYLCGFVLLFALSRNALTERVPLYLSSQESIDTLAHWLPPGAAVLDLGSGDGRVVLQLARQRADLQLCGVENALLPWLWSRWRYLRAGRPANVSLHYGNFWDLNWSRFDVIHAFLSPAPMARVWAHFQQHAANHAQLVSNSFGIAAVPPQQRLPLNGPLQKELLIWRHNHGHR